MPSYALSRAADDDIAEIATHSLLHWGAARAKRYLLQLQATCQTLAEFPGMGTDISFIHPATLRMQAASHVVFYRKTGPGILIMRSLHQSMDVTLHL